MTSSKPASWRSLPLELRQYVASMLDPLDRLDFRTLKSLVAVGREERDFFLPYFFGTVAIYDQNQDVFTKPSALDRIMQLIAGGGFGGGEDEGENEGMSEEDWESGEEEDEELSGKADADEESGEEEEAEKEGEGGEVEATEPEKAQAKGDENARNDAASPLDTATAGVDEEAANDDNEPPCGAWDKTVDRSSKVLFKLLKRNPKLAALPREIAFYGAVAEDAASEVLKPWFDLCPNLDRARFIGTAPNDDAFDRRWNPPEEAFNILMDLYETPERMRSFIIRKCSPDQVDSVLVAATSSPNLKQLSLGADMAKGEGRGVLGDTSFRDEPAYELETLECEVPVVPSLFKHMTKTCGTSLTSLTLLLALKKPIPYDLSHLTNLRNLTLDYGVAQTAVGTFSTAAPLRSLELRHSPHLAPGGSPYTFARADKDEEEDAEYAEMGETPAQKAVRHASRDAARAKQLEAAQKNSIGAVLPHLPPSLVRLSLPYYLRGGLHPSEPDELATLVEALANPSFLPNLRSLKVADPGKEQRSWMQEQMTKKEKKRFVQRRKELVEVCEKRGIFLSRSVEAWYEKEETDGTFMRVGR